MWELFRLWIVFLLTLLSFLYCWYWNILVYIKFSMFMNKMDSKIDLSAGLEMTIDRVASYVNVFLIYILLDARCKCL